MRTDNRRFDVGAIKRDNRIEEVIESCGIELRPSGRSLVGLCPFHNDRNTPNLNVYPDTQSWCCYACQERNGRKMGGDVIRFVELIDGISFTEAAEKLERRRQALPSPTAVPSPPPRRPKPRWEQLDLPAQELLNRVAQHYQDRLWQEPEALAYVRRRGIPDWLIREHQLGYADGRSLRASFTGKAERDLLLELGLVQEHQDADGHGWMGELLRQRVVVPELRGGCCVWLIGRRCTDHPKAPKYLAPSGERPVLGLERVMGQREVVMTEGVFDYLTALAWELPAFCTCGTSLPPSRLGFLARAEIVHGVLDPDAAGRLGTERLALLLQQRLRPIELPRGCDLNELSLQAGGRDEFFQLLAASRGGVGMDEERVTCA